MSKEAINNNSEANKVELTRWQKVAASVGGIVTDAQVEWANTKVGFRRRLAAAGLILATAIGVGGLVVSSSEAEDNECHPNDNGCVPGSTVTFPDKCIENPEEPECQESTTTTQEESTTTSSSIIVTTSTTQGTTTTTFNVPTTPTTHDTPTTLDTPDYPNAETANGPLGGSFEQDGIVYTWTSEISA